jgi:DNA-binding GntR family transcriptional regulator
MTVRPRSAADVVYLGLREQICLLDLPPGLVLREVVIAEQFGVSRTPVREALTMLRVDGLVTRRHGEASMVSTVDFKELRTVYALRMRLTDIIADFTVSPIPVTIVDRLTGIRVDVSRIEVGDFRRLGELYNRLHETMLEAVGNEPLRTICDRLFRQTSRVWIQVLPEMDWDEEVALVLEEIDLSVDALRERSPIRLSEVRTKYMRMLLDRFNAYLIRP